jgi:hypothetical protein
MFDQDLELPIELLAGESDDHLYELTLAAWPGPASDQQQFLPSNLESMDPGPFLGAILSVINLAHLSGHDVVRVMQAHHRQVAHHQAGEYHAMSETAHCTDPDTTNRTTTVNEFAPEEIGAALTLTRRMANRQLGIALDLAEQTPSVHQALSSGQIDAAKAALITGQTTHLEADTRNQVIETVLPVAPELTTGQISARIRRLCVEADPEEAEALFETSLAERKVIAEPNLEGTAALIISQCSPNEVFAARDHINRLARRLKTGDETRNIDQLRADVALGLLTGDVQGTGNRGGSVVITVDLETLSQISESPGELSGYGPVHAELARRVALEQASGSWTGVVTDPETGEPLHAVALRRRPTAAQTRKIRALHPVCVHPGCRMPAINCDLDHTVDHARGGPTTVNNHAPLCRRHHLTKHKGRWNYRKLGRTTVEWTTPLGHTYRTSRPP